MQSELNVLHAMCLPNVVTQPLLLSKDAFTEPSLLLCLDNRRLREPDNLLARDCGA